MHWDKLPDLMTVEEAAMFMRRGKACIYNLCHTADFPSIKIGRTWRIVKEKLPDWLDSQSKK